MELSKAFNKLSGIFKKYGYVFLIVGIGLILMAIPTGTVMNQMETPQKESHVTQPSLEERLSIFLSNIDGAGEVHVILTVAEGEEIVYQTDERLSTDNNSTSTQLDTVTVTASDRADNGLIKQINPQTYLGAVIICSGADNPVVRLSIVDAISKLTGLGANQISVMKMK